MVGAQKSGSTALLGQMLFHPQFVPPRRKELHYFDMYVAAGRLKGGFLCVFLWFFGCVCVLPVTLPLGAGAQR
jgi:hypothetical protein